VAGVIRQALPAPAPRGARGVLTDRRGDPALRLGDPVAASSSASTLAGLGSDLGLNSGAAYAVS
jgi:hypothetical protein